MIKPMATETLLLCKHCNFPKPKSEMRKDSSYPDGVRSQCRSCKNSADAERKAGSNGKTNAKVTVEATTEMSVAKQKKQARKEAHRRKKAKERSRTPKTFPCSRCGRDDLLFEEMSKDKRKVGGVGTQCLKCRREREKELKTEALAKEEQELVERSADTGNNDWVYCFKCNAQVRSHALRQPPTTIPGLYPPGARLCSKCISKVGERDDLVRKARLRRGLPENASRNELVSAARVEALKQLIEEHDREYQTFLEQQMTLLGVEQEKKWISL